MRWRLAASWVCSKADAGRRLRLRSGQCALRCRTSSTQAGPPVFGGRSAVATPGGRSNSGARRALPHPCPFGSGRRRALASVARTHPSRHRPTVRSVRRFNPGRRRSVKRTVGRRARCLRSCRGRRWHRGDGRPRRPGTSLCPVSVRHHRRDRTAQRSSKVTFRRVYHSVGVAGRSGQAISARTPKWSLATMPVIGSSATN